MRGLMSNSLCLNQTGGKLLSKDKRASAEYLKTYNETLRQEKRS